MHSDEDYLDEEVLDLEALREAHEKRQKTNDSDKESNRHRYEREPPADEEEDDSSRYYRHRRGRRRRKRLMAALWVFLAVFIFVGVCLYFKR